MHIIIIFLDYKNGINKIINIFVIHGQINNQNNIQMVVQKKINNLNLDKYNIQQLQVYHLDLQEIFYLTHSIFQKA